MHKRSYIMQVSLQENQGKVMTTVTEMKCACPSCLCIVSLAKAINKEGKYYCSDGCAEGHQTIKGCGHNGCGC